MMHRKCHWNKTIVSDIVFFEKIILLAGAVQEMGDRKG
jgi:hypothetical protein